MLVGAFPGRTGMQSEVTVSDNPPGGPQDPSVILRAEHNVAEQVEFAFENGIEQLTVFFTPQNGIIPRNRPKQLKMELDSKITENKRIRNVKITRNNKILIETEDKTCAKEIAAITEILGIPVTSYIQSENITSRFVLHNIDTLIPLADIGNEIQNENNLRVKEVRRFTKRGLAGPQLTETVLITTYGTKLPNEIKFFYMLEKIKPFFDKPRQCTNCWRYDHATRKCGNRMLCKKCGGEHHFASCEAEAAHCSNCEGSHFSTEQNCPTRVREMSILKYKSEYHLTIAEARRRYAEQTKTKQFATVIRSEPSQTTHYITKKELETTLDTFYQKSQESLKTLLEKQATMFTQMINQVVNSFTAILSKVVSSNGSPLDTVVAIQTPATHKDPNPPKKPRPSSSTSPRRMPPNFISQTSSKLNQSTQLNQDKLKQVSEAMEGDS